MSAALKIFIIYAREDRIYKDDLLKSLKLLQTQGLIEPWHDSNIKPGDEWDKEIKAHLRAADIILPIISFDFFDSDYIHRVEIVEAFERYDRGEALIIPIIADSCPWMDYPRLRDFQALPAEGKPIDDWADRKKAMSSIYEGVKGVILVKKKKDEVEARRKKEEAEKLAEESKWQNQRLAKQQLNIALQANDVEVRIRYFNDAIRLDPEYADAYYQRGNAKYRLGQYAEAIKDYQTSLIIDPKHNDAKVNLRLLEEKMKQKP